MKYRFFVVMTVLVMLITFSACNSNNSNPLSSNGSNPVDENQLVTDFELQFSG